MFPRTGVISSSCAGAAQTAASRRTYLIMAVLLLGRGVLFRRDFSCGFRVHRGGAAQSDIGGQAVLLPKLAQEWILSRQVAGHDTRGPVDFLHHGARVGRDLLVEGQSV